MQSHQTVAEIRVGKLAANVVGFILTIAFCVVGVLFAQMLPHHAPDTGWHGIALLGSFVVLLPTHEALHAAGLRIFASVPWRQIKFGVMWDALMPYCHCTIPVTVRAYRRMALLPLWVTGLLCFASLIAFPANWLGIVTGVSVAACVGDVWMVSKLRHFPDTLLVLDSPSEIGCDILADTTAPAA